MNATLVAGPWCGSTLGELLCWQGWLRKMSKSYRKTIVVAPEEKRILYQDFASKIVQSTPTLANAEYVTGRDVPVNFISMQPVVQDQSLIQIAHPTETQFHATVLADVVYPLTRKQWAEIVCEFDSSYDVAWVSDDLNAHAIGGTDLRNAGFLQVLDAVRASKVVVAPSGGITAMAMLVGTPIVTWIDKDQVSLYAQRNLWNPLGVHGVVFRGRPTVAQIKNAIKDVTNFTPEETESASWGG